MHYLYSIPSHSYAQDVPYMHMCATKDGCAGAMDNVPNKPVRKAMTNQHKDVSPPGTTLELGGAGAKVVVNYFHHKEEADEVVENLLKH